MQIRFAAAPPFFSFWQGNSYLKFIFTHKKSASSDGVNCASLCIISPVKNAFARIVVMSFAA